jgi:hypothetical protein
MDEQASKPSVALSVPRGLVVLKSVFSIVGLLLMGAGVCSGVFCVHAFQEAIQLENASQAALFQANQLQQATPGSLRIYEGTTLDLAGWQALARQHQLSSLWKKVEAYALLSWSIGLFLGGTTLGLLGWGLRPRVAPL